MSAPGRKPRVILLRGHQVNSWHLRPWGLLTDRYDVAVLQTGRNWFDTDLVNVRKVPARALRDLLPQGRLGDLAVRLPGDRYLNLAGHLAGADIVHSQDLGFWYSMQAARLKEQLGFKLALTVWETIPFLDTYRNVRTRPYRRLVLERTDSFLATTERARRALLLEGAPQEKIELCPPGVDDELFSNVREQATSSEHVIVSPGRLAWHKGHQDVMRAVAALRKNVIGGSGVRPRVLIVGSGPERDRLLRYAAELDIADAVEIRAEVPYAEMPSIYRAASCMVLASLPEWYWEEQFGMVLLEAMFAGLPVMASATGAIPEVTGGIVPTFAPGDWEGLAQALDEGPLRQDPGRRVSYDSELLARYTSSAAADRLAAAYDKVLAR